MVTNEFVPASPELRELYSEAVALGYEPGMDFFITGIPGAVSSELILLYQEDGFYVVYYRDMGRARELARSRELEAIRPRFLDALANLAGPRGRGPTAGHERTDPYEGLSVDERVEELRKLGWFPHRSDLQRDAPPVPPIS